MRAGFTEARARRFGPYRRAVYLDIIAAMRQEAKLRQADAGTIGELRGAQRETAVANTYEVIDELMGVDREQRREAVQEKILREANQFWDQFKQMQDHIKQDG